MFTNESINVILGVNGKDQVYGFAIQGGAQPVVVKYEDIDTRLGYVMLTVNKENRVYVNYDAISAIVVQPKPKNQPKG